MKQTNRYNLLADKPEGNTTDRGSKFSISLIATLAGEIGN